MYKFLGQALVISPAILVAAWITSQGAIAKELSVNSEVQSFPIKAKTGEILVAQVSEDALNSELLPGDSESSDAMADVTSVSQLSDVQPTDWAFQALQSLVERYGCIEGYPDRTYRGNRAMTRYEFAAGLNACLDRMRELIAASGGQGIGQGELDQIRRLQEEFKTELAAMKNRIDSLETRTSRLETQQFSPTTKLFGVAAFNITDAWASDKVKAEGLNAFGFSASRVRADDGSLVPFVREVDDPKTTFSYMVWLNLITSFTGKDVLVTRLGAGNGSSPANLYASSGWNNTSGVPFFDQTTGLNTNNVDILQLYYTFPVGNKLRVTLGPTVSWYNHFDLNQFTNPFVSAGSFNSINSTLVTSTKRGAGAIVEWNISKQLDLRFGYLTENLEFLPGPRPASDPSRGLFNGADTITGELTVKPSKNANIRLLYQRSNLARNLNGQISFQPIVGVADDGFGGRVHDATSDTFEFNFDWLITKRFAVFGRYSYGSTHIDPINSTLESGDINAQSIQAGVAFPDLGKQGAMATIAFGIPFDVLEGRKFLVSGGGNGGTQYDLEFNYFFPINQNIGIIPGFYLINNINNFDDNPMVFVGNVRTVFTF